ncbi:MAG: M4 family metallopeptidase, partial [Phycisphaerae bacterium]
MASSLGKGRCTIRKVAVGLACVVLGAILPAGLAWGQNVPAQVKVRRSPTTGLVTFITPVQRPDIQVTPGPGQTRVRPTDFFQQYGHLFGITDPPKQLRLMRSSVGLLGRTHTTYQQMHRGVPVFTGELKVHQDPAGRIVAVNGDFYQISPKLATIPGISDLDAQQFAADSVAWLDPQIHSSELVVVDPGWYGDPVFGARLAYHVVVTNTTGYQAEAIFVDAHTGEVMDQWNLICTAKDRRIFDGAGGAAIPGTLARAEGDAPVADAQVNAAYDYYGDTYDYFSLGFGRDSIDGLGLSMVATVNHNSGICPNAFWDGILKQMVFCDGFVKDDVVGHELTHGITEHTANLVYQNESGQLNEAYSDIFGEMVDLFNGGAAFVGTNGPTPWTPHSTGPGVDTGNQARTACSPPPAVSDGVRWLVGEDFGSFYFRDMWDPTCLFDPDKKTSSRQDCGRNDDTDNGGVHSGSGIANHAFAIMTDGKTFNGQTVTGIGPIKAGAVWYQALTVYLTPGSDYQDAFVALNQSAQDLIGT